MINRNGISLQQWGGGLGIQHQHPLLCVIYIQIYHDYMRRGGRGGAYVRQVADLHPNLSWLHVKGGQLGSRGGGLCETIGLYYVSSRSG